MRTDLLPHTEEHVKELLEDILRKNGINFENAVQIKVNEDDPETGRLLTSTQGFYVTFGNWRLELTSCLDNTSEEGPCTVVGLYIDILGEEPGCGSLASITWCVDSTYSHDVWHWHLFEPDDLKSICSPEEVALLRNLVEKLGPDITWKADVMLEKFSFLRAAKIMGLWIQEQA